MRTIDIAELVPEYLIGAVATRQVSNLLTIYYAGDEVPDVPVEDDPDAPLREQFAASEQAAKEAEFAAYKARSGAPSYKAAAVKIAAEKLGVLDAIDAAIMDLVNKASDKSLYVWWSETPTISRGDAEWQEIEPAVTWGKGVSADDLFALAAQI